MHRRFLSAVVTAGVLSLTIPPLHAQPVGPRIVNGVLTSDHPTAGALLYAGGDPATTTNTSTMCSGTLVGCETFLTAAHCVADDPTPSHYLVFLQHAGFFPLASITVHPSFPKQDATGDIAVLKLATPVTGVAPSPINAEAEVPLGTDGTIVGFGRSSGFASDFGLKRAGAVSTSTCAGVSSTASSLCWRFETPIGPPGDDSNTCNGDSGGPLFVDNGCGLSVAGATSFGINTTCGAFDLAVDASVFGHLSFVESAGGADLASTTCGGVSHVGDTNTIVDGFAGTLSGGVPEATHSFAVPAGRTALRVAMNGIDNGSNFNLYVRRGSPPTTSLFDCAHTGGNQYGYCEIASPAADTWWVLADHVSGSGAYQITATSFTAALGAFPNDGNACDDLDACTTPDTCSIHRCASGGAAPDGTPCDDGTVCTVVDACASGICVGDPTPRGTCKQPPTKSILVLKDKELAKRDKVIWKWLKGPATTFAELGDPTAGSPDYTLCVYDESAATPTLALSAVAPGGGLCKNERPCWKRLGSDTEPRGFRYNDRDLTPQGLLKMILRADEAGKAKMIVIAKGASLPLPGPVSGTQYFSQDPRVHVQLVQDDGDCWAAEYGSAAKNEPELFKAKCGSQSDPCL